MTAHLKRMWSKRNIVDEEDEDILVAEAIDYSVPKGVSPESME